MSPVSKERKVKLNITPKIDSAPEEMTFLTCEMASKNAMAYLKSFSTSSMFISHLSTAFGKHFGVGPTHHHRGYVATEGLHALYSTKHFTYKISLSQQRP